MSKLINCTIIFKKYGESQVLPACVREDTDVAACLNQAKEMAEREGHKGNSLSEIPSEILAKCGIYPQEGVKTVIMEDERFGITQE